MALRSGSFASFDPGLRRPSPPVGRARRDWPMPVVDLVGHRPPAHDRLGRDAVEQR